jgi:hypothetical protein|tara:strand:+ start:2180 stop:2491 length:312 start_codon:yes stop_codon:yes gene_type:complete
MITHVTQSEFINTFIDSKTYSNKFSIPGLHALFEYLEEYEEGTGEQIQFDMISLCCGYSEYSSLEEFNTSYSTDFTSIDQIREQTEVIPINEGDGNSFIVLDY